MKPFLLIFIVGCLLSTTGFTQPPLIATFTGVLKKDNTLYLQFTDAQKKEWLFNALKSEFTPYVVYSTDHSGNITVNYAILNNRFSIQYTKALNDGRTENRIIRIREAGQ